MQQGSLGGGEGGGTGGFDPPASPAADESGTGSSAASNRLAGSGATLTDTLQELQGRADQMMDEAADRLESAALRIDELADRAPLSGVGAKAGDLASNLADGLEAVARYLRDHDVQTLQRDVGRIAAARPLSTVLLAVGAGYVVGKVLR